MGLPIGEKKEKRTPGFRETINLKPLFSKKRKKKKKSLQFQLPSFQLLFSSTITKLF
mgnify:CR=1 FL=1